MRTASAPIKAILYDLDGTLVDNFCAIHRSIVHAEEALGLPPSPYKRVRAVVGGGIELTLARLVGPELAPRALPHFQKFFPTVMLEGLEPMPGANELLEQLHARGVRQALLTNKYGAAARTIVAHLGWDKWLELVLGAGDTAWRKPERELGLYAVEKLGVTAAETIMIGDSPFDLDTAANAGLRGYAVATGSHTRAQLVARQPPPEGVFDNLPELAGKTFGLSP